MVFPVRSCLPRRLQRSRRRLPPSYDLLELMTQASTAPRFALTCCPVLHCDVRLTDTEVVVPFTAVALRQRKALPRAGSDSAVANVRRRVTRTPASMQRLRASLAAAAVLLACVSVGATVQGDTDPQNCCMMACCIVNGDYTCNVSGGHAAGSPARDPCAAPHATMQPGALVNDLRRAPSALMVALHAL